MVLLGAGALSAAIVIGRPGWGGLAMVIMVIGIMATLYLRWRARATGEEPAQTARVGRGMGISLVVAVLFMLSGVPLFGLPGLFVYALVSPVVDAFMGLRALDSLPMYGGFAVIFMMHLVWPWSIPVGYVLAQHFGKPEGPSRVLIMGGVIYGWAIAMGFAGILMAH
jgi:hypothetical protein